jgi:hypothetical protein
MHEDRSPRSQAENVLTVGRKASRRAFSISDARLVEGEG